MLRLLLLAIGLGTLPALCPAEVGLVSVTDAAKHATKADFLHTFEYYILPLGKKAEQVGKCQATRIGRRWFATAAHCVEMVCKNGCQIQVDLLENNVSALASVTHTKQKPAVFVMPGFSYKIFVKNDFALIRLDVDRTPFTYYRREAGNKRTLLTQEQFNQALAKNPAARSALHRIKSPVYPPILVFDEGNYLLDRKISVISIFDGKRSVKPNPNPVHYVKKLEFAYTKNFGVRRGMSGSGVMSNTGEFLGVISGIFQTTKAAANKEEPPSVLDEKFMFFVFNQPAVEFMKSVMGSDFYKLDVKDAYPNFVRKSRQNYSELIERMERMYKQAQQPTTPTPQPGKKSTQESAN